MPRRDVKESTIGTVLPGNLEALDQGLRIWQPHSARKLTREDVRHIELNLSEFLSILAGWDAKDQSKNIERGILEGIVARR